MKTWIRRTALGVLGAGVLFGGLAACSHHSHWRGHGFSQMSEADAAKLKERMVERIGGKLDLDASQKAKLGVLADTLREQRNALLAGGDPRAELASVISGPQFDRQKAQALVQSKTGAVQSKSPDVIAAMADFYDSLKPEQQTKVRELMQRRGRHGWRV